MNNQYLLLLLFSPLVEAEVQTPKELGLTQVLMPMLLVIALIVTLAWVLKKFRLGTPVLNQGVQILASAPVSSQARVCLIRTGGKDIIIGVTNQQVSHLHTFDEPVELSETEGPGADFPELFRQLLAGRGKKEE